MAPAAAISATAMASSRASSTTDSRGVAAATVAADSGESSNGVLPKNACATGLAAIWTRKPPPAVGVGTNTVRKSTPIQATIAAIRAKARGRNEPANAESDAAMSADGNTMPISRKAAWGIAHALPCSIWPPAQNSSTPADGSAIAAREPATRAATNSNESTGADASISEMPSRSASAARSVKAAA